MTWINVAPLRMEKQATRPVLIEFWDFCRPSSLRTLPYLQAWHERYGAAGLRVISVHAPGFETSRDEDQVRSAVERLDIRHPVAIDAQFELWHAYENQGWPSRYLFAPRMKLAQAWFGEGGYRETEEIIQELLGAPGDPVPLVRPSDDDDAPIVIPTAEHAGPHDGPYAAGEAWIVTDRAGTVAINGEDRELAHPGAHLLIAHERHTADELTVEPRGDVEVLLTWFAPGLA
ncbi:MAG: DipZ protein [Actinobacteria bacterium]|nr:DipZ protein [Actinomycetota bacterium]